MHLMKPNQLLTEFEFTTRAIQSLEDVLAKLKARETSVAHILDIITKPVSAQCSTNIPNKGFMYLGEFTKCTTTIGIYRKVMKILWREFPEKHRDMAFSMGSVGYSRCYVAKDRASLFDHKPFGWVMRFSEILYDDWYIDTNVTPERIRKILPLAICAAGLKLNKDIVINWD